MSARADEREAPTLQEFIAALAPRFAVSALCGGDRLDRAIRSVAIQKPGLVLTGLMIHGGFTLVTVKLVFLLAFLLFMGPVATHAVAAAALQAGLKPRAVVNSVLSFLRNSC